MTIEEIKKKRDEYEKLTEITKNLRDDAIKAKTESETKISIATDELKQLGINPDKAEEELEKLNAEIEQQLAEIEDSIPMELLKEMKRI